MSSSRTPPLTRERKAWNNLVPAVDKAHDIILENIKGFEALKGGNYAVVKEIEDLFQGMDIDKLSEPNLIRCQDHINLKCRCQAIRDGVRDIPKLTGRQINATAKALEERKKAIVHYLRMSTNRHTETRETEDNAQKLSDKTEHFNTILKLMFAHPLPTPSRK